MSKRSSTPPPGNSPKKTTEVDDHNTGYTTYSVAVRTSNIENASSRAFVFVQLIDVDGKMTDKIKLKCSLTHRVKFRQGHSDLFLLLDQPILGRLKEVNIHHRKKANAEEDERSWHLHSVMVINHELNELYRFDAHQWVGQNDDQEFSFCLKAVGEPSTVLPDFL